jgi:hypothetical protein
LAVSAGAHKMVMAMVAAVTTAPTERYAK